MRTYAETADTSFKDQYNAVVEIRNGTRARPQDYHRVYWNFMAGGEAKPRPDEAAISTQDLMKQAGFTGEEFALLNEATSVPMPLSGSRPRPDAREGGDLGS